MLESYANGDVKDKRIKGYTKLITVPELEGIVPLTEKTKETVYQGRKNIVDCLKGNGRIITLVGPCSIHDVDAAKDYAEKLIGLREKVKDWMEIVMRVYFEKPRTTVGWKGLIYEPYLNGKIDVNEGLLMARRLLKDISQMGLPIGTEFLDTLVPQYIADFVSWGAIGARTMESPPHRAMASGLSMPIGFKNSTHGDIYDLQITVNAILAARYDGQVFLGLDRTEGLPSAAITEGNNDAHLVLRGLKKPNYDAKSVKKALDMLKAAGLEERLMIDCSHGNSNKDFKNQPKVFKSVIGQIADGKNEGIIGINLESNIYEDKQDVPDDLSKLKYGVSITDACISWPTTEELLLEGFKTLSRRHS